MKRILITGVSSGLGEAITQSLLEKGMIVDGLSRRTPPHLAEWQKSFPDQFHFNSINLNEVDSLNEQLLEIFPAEVSWDGLINNAGIAYDDLVTNLQLQPLESMFEVNVYAPMFLSRFFIRRCLLHRKAGRIIHISSICVHEGFKGLAMYGATKGALEAFSLNLNQEWNRSNIYSECVAPKFMPTEMTKKLSEAQLAKIELRGGMDDMSEVVNNVVQRVV